MRTIVPITSFATENHGTASVGEPITVPNDLAEDLIRAGHAGEVELLDPALVPDNVTPGETPGWPVDDDGNPIVLADHIREFLGYSLVELDSTELEPTLDDDGNPITVDTHCIVCGEELPDASASAELWFIPGKGHAHADCVDEHGNALDPAPATSPVAADAAVIHQGNTPEYYAGLTYKQLKELNQSRNLGLPGNASGDALRAAIQADDEARLKAAAAPDGTGVGSDGIEQD